MDIKKLRRRIEDRLRKGSDVEIMKTAHFLGMDKEGWVTIESSFSGDSIETSLGRLTHTNGHYGFEGIGKVFWLAETPAHIAYLKSEGNAAVCSVAAFHIDRLENWLMKDFIIRDVDALDYEESGFKVFGTNGPEGTFERHKDALEFVLEQ